MILAVAIVIVSVGLGLILYCICRQLLRQGNGGLTRAVEGGEGWGGWTVGKALGILGLSPALPLPCISGPQFPHLQALSQRPGCEYGQDLWRHTLAQGFLSPARLSLSPLGPGRRHGSRERQGPPQF